MAECIFSHQNYFGSLSVNVSASAVLLADLSRYSGELASGLPNN